MGNISVHRSAFRISTEEYPHTFRIFFSKYCELGNTHSNFKSYFGWIVGELGCSNSIFCHHLHTLMSIKPCIIGLSFECKCFAVLWLLKKASKGFIKVAHTIYEIYCKSYDSVVWEHYFKLLFTKNIFYTSIYSNLAPQDACFRTLWICSCFVVMLYDHTVCYIEIFWVNKWWRNLDFWVNYCIPWNI